MADSKTNSAGSLSTLQEDQGLGTLSSPLDLQRRVMRPQIQFDFVPFLDLCVIALLFALLHSELVFAPGLAIDLPDSQHRQLDGQPVTSVLTLRPDMVLFDGARYRLGNLEAGFRRYFQNLEARKRDRRTVLLVKMDKQVGMQPFLSVCEIARAAGFDRVQIAALPEPGRASPFFDTPGNQAAPALP